MPAPADTTLILNPFLHVDGDRIYDPLQDRAVVPGDRDYALLRKFIDDGTVDPALEREGWVVRPDADLSRSHHLKIVSLETMTACNQKCYFCPVSIAPREDYDMPTELFERIVNELTMFPTVESVFLQSYNEPTLDRRFVEQCTTLFRAGLPVAVLSNGSGLTPGRVEAILRAGQLRYLCINLSTMDRERYARDRGNDHVDLVLRNLEAMKHLPLARQMKIVVLGTGDDVHTRDFEEIRERFGASRFEIERHEVMDRAGWLDIGLHPEQKKRRLRGCDNVGSRPLQHMHITPHGTCVLCCEDYDEKYVVGNLADSTIAEVLAGPGLAQMRKWVYGIEEAPEDFICRSCVFARE
ncbi:MAG: radical SAM/SPASM domain-containing protein [Thermoanaerobaculia bacterium]